MDKDAAFEKWVIQGVLVALPAASRQQARYTKPELIDQMDLTYSLSFGLDNENKSGKNFN